MICFNLFNISKCNVLYGVVEKVCDNVVVILIIVIWFFLKLDDDMIYVNKNLFKK